MDAFFQYFFNFMNNIFESLWGIVVAIWDAIVGILNIKFYMDLFKTYKDDLSVGGWIAALLAHLIVLIIFILLVYLIVRGLRVLFRFKVPVVEYEELKDEVVRVKREILKVNYEKDKILAMKINELGMTPNEAMLNLEEGEALSEGENVEEKDLDNLSDEEKEVLAKAGKPIDPSQVRFPKLTGVDNYYLSGEYVAPEFQENYSLEELCTNFRNFAASRLGLYYELEVIREVFASFGAAKLMILQGISGTGKTSLPYAIGQFI